MKFLQLSVIAFCMLAISACAEHAVETETLFLSGRGSDDAVNWEFFCTDGRNSRQWTMIPVPSNWELHGFGEYNYGTQDNKAAETGKYRTTFRLPSDWATRRISIVFEGAMTDTEVLVNGTPAGPKHQGGFYRFDYDITELVSFAGDNLLEVTVSKVSSDATVERAERWADYWVFGGIYRPVYLRAVPVESIDSVAIDAKACGDLSARICLSGIVNADSVKAVMTDEQGVSVAAFSCAVTGGQSTLTLESSVPAPKTWTAETPCLHWLQVDLCDGDRVIHRVKERFGFRTIEVVEGKGIFVNGQRVLLKGVNRHSFWPDSGRALNRQVCCDDVRLIKSMNMNAVRMSHYPPDKAFLEACDELGLYVIDELAGWQSPPYSAEVGRPLVKSMIKRDVNHPSIIFWANGNEGGWNTELDADYALHDPQARPVLHPWAKFSGIDTDHYESYASTRQKLDGPLIFMPTEFLHGLYDGGAGAGLEDYWNLMVDSPLAGGGFLWALLDEGVIRTDRNGIIDAAGNAAPDGIVGPYRQKEGSFFTIKELWSPIQVQMQLPDSSGRLQLPLRNLYSFTNTSQLLFTYQLVNFADAVSPDSGHEVEKTQTIQAPDIAPGTSGFLEFRLDENWRRCDALYVNAKDASGHSLWTWSLPLKSRGELARAERTDEGEPVRIASQADRIIVSGTRFRYAFDNSTGLLAGIAKDGQSIALSNGPRLVFGKDAAQQAQASPAQVDYKIENGAAVITAQNSCGMDRFTWTVRPGGQLLLAYEYSLQGEYDHFGISFDCPESQMKQMRWLGQGPHRVWKNRIKGTWLDVWQRNYNRVVGGQQWDYPMFAGNYGDFYWLDLETESGHIRVFNQTDQIFFRVAELLNGRDPAKTKHLSPLGDLSFLHSVSPIGTKFLKPAELGPMGEPNKAQGSYSGQLLFVF